MDFEQNKSNERLGEILGYIFGYFLFTTIIFIIFSITHKIPKSWTYYNIMGITLLIATIGWALNKWMK